MIRDLSPKKFAVGQSRDWTRERFRRQLAQPQRNAGGSRRLGERAAVDHARKRAVRIEPCMRNSQREQKRGKACGEVGHARVSHGQRAHGALETRLISPKPAFEQVGTPGHLTRGQQKVGCHDNSFEIARQWAAADTI